MRLQSLSRKRQRLEDAASRKELATATFEAEEEARQAGLDPDSAEYASLYSLAMLETFGFDGLLRRMIADEAFMLCVLERQIGSANCSSSLTTRTSPSFVMLTRSFAPTLTRAKAIVYATRPEL